MVKLSGLPSQRKLNGRKRKTRFPKIFHQSEKKSVKKGKFKIPNVNSGLQESDIYEEILHEERRYSPLPNIDDNGSTDKLSNVPLAVLSVMHRLQEAVKKRKRNEAKEKIDEIMARVSVALQHSGIPDITASDCVNKGNKKSLNLAETMKVKAERSLIADIFTSSEASCRTRNDIIIELNAWFNVVKGDWEKICTKDISKSFSNSDVTNILEAFNNSSESICKLEKLFKLSVQAAMKKPPIIRQSFSFSSFDSEGGSSLSDTESALSCVSSAKNESKTNAVVENKQSSHKMLKRGFNKISVALQDSLQPQADVKKNFKNVTKQFKVISNMFHSKDVRIEELEDEVLQSESTLKDKDVKCQQQEDKDMEIIKRLKAEKLELEEKIELLQQPIEPILRKASFDYDDFQRERRVSTESQTSFELKKSRRRRRSVAVSKRVRSRKQSIDIKTFVAASMTGLYDYSDSSESESDIQECINEEAEWEIREKKLKDEMAEIEDEVKKRDVTISSQEEKIDELNIKIEKSEKEKLKLVNQNVVKDKKIKEFESKFEIQQKEIIAEKEKSKWKAKAPEEQEGKENYKYSRKFNFNKKSNDQALLRMKKQWEKEIYALTDYMHNEKERFKANIRQLTLDHEKSEINIRSDNAHTLRALYRFKRVIDRNLYQDDELNSDTNEQQELDLLQSYQEGKHEAILSDSAIIILIKLEETLGKILLSRKIKMKETNAKKVSAVRNLNEYKTRLNKTKEICEQQEKIVRSAIDQNTMLSNAYQKLLLNNEWLQKRATPHAELINNYNTVKNDFVVDFNDDGAKKGETKDIRKCEEHKIEVSEERKVEEYNKSKEITCSSNLMPKSKQKISIISEAYENKDISLLVFNEAKEIVFTSQKAANKQLIWIVKRYMAFKKMKLQRKVLEDLSEKRENEANFQRYLKSAEAQYTLECRQFELLKIELQKERERAILKFGRLLEKKYLGKSLKMPLSSENYSPCFLNKPIIKNCKIPFKSGSEELNDVVGHSMQTRQDIISCWKMPPRASNRLVRITTPKILEMDVNRCRKATQIQTKKIDQPLYLPAIASLYP